MKELTRQDILALMTFERLFEEAGISREAIERAAATGKYRLQDGSVEEHLNTLFSVAVDLGVFEKEKAQGAFQAAFDAVKTENSQFMRLPKGWLQQRAEQDVVASTQGALTEAAKDVDPAVVQEALGTPGRRGVLIPSMRQVRAAAGPVGHDLAEKATQARQWDKQKAAYDALYRTGKFLDPSITYQTHGFAPAIAPEPLSSEEVMLERGRIEDRITKLQEIRGEIETSKNKTAGERERTKRELAKEIMRNREENIENLGTNERAHVDRLTASKAEKDEEIDSLRPALRSSTHSKRTTIESGASTLTGELDATKRDEALSKEMTKLAGEPEALFHLIATTIENADGSPGLDDSYATMVSDNSNWKNDKDQFLSNVRIISTGIDDANLDILGNAFDAVKTGEQRVEDLSEESANLQTEIDDVVFSSESSSYRKMFREVERWALGVFDAPTIPGRKTETRAAPDLSNSEVASDYVSGAVPGASLLGTDVRLPTGDVIGYADFVSQYPTIQVDSDTGEVIPVTADPKAMIDQQIIRLTEELKEVDEDPLSAMDALKEEIIADPRYRAWVEKSGYTNPEKAYEYFKSHVAQTAKLKGPVTDRQVRDANILQGREHAELPERIGAVARSVIGPTGRERRQTRRKRRRSAILNMLSPGARKSRITEAGAAETQGEPAAETAPPAAEAGAPVETETAPGIQATWKDKNPKDDTEYTLRDNDIITYINKEGKAVAVSPGDTGYDAIMEMRPPPPLSPEQEAIAAAMTEGGVASAGLPRKVTTSREELKEELAAVPGAETREGASPEETERIGLRERLRYGKEERALGEKGDAAFKEAQKKQGYEEARAAAEAAREKDEEPPAWAAIILDMEPLEGLERGEIQRATTEPKAAPEEMYVSPGEGTPGGPGVSPTSTGHMQQGVSVAKERTVPVLPSPLAGRSLTPVGGRVGREGEPVSEEEQRKYDAGEAVMKEDFPPYVPPHERLPRPPDAPDDPADPGAFQHRIHHLSREEARKKALIDALKTPSGLP